MSSSRVKSSLYSITTLCIEVKKTPPYVSSRENASFQDNKSKNSKHNQPTRANVGKSITANAVSSSRDSNLMVYLQAERMKAEEKESIRRHDIEMARQE